ncbi:MAG: antibiotic biosynthesis monooxygenase [Chryseobacterium sp.]|nr:antibiotic biosynthesis monooxygenase [Chryseobacterium sp.]
MSEIHVVADLRFKENSVADVIPLLNGMVENTRKEEGCVSYDLVQDSKNIGIFFTLEVWESQDDIDRHLHSEGIKTMMEKAKPFFVAEPAIHQCQKLS